MHAAPQLNISDRLMLKAACTTAFHGLLQYSEVTSGIALASVDIHLQPLHHVELHLQTSKTDISLWLFDSHRQITAALLPGRCAVSIFHCGHAARLQRYLDISLRPCCPVAALSGYFTAAMLPGCCPISIFHCGHAARLLCYLDISLRPCFKVAARLLIYPNIWKLHVTALPTLHSSCSARANTDPAGVHQALEAGPNRNCSPGRLPIHELLVFHRHSHIRSEGRRTFLADQHHGSMVPEAYQVYIQRPPTTGLTVAPRLLRRHPKLSAQTVVQVMS